jgi:hypothetical protein
VLQADVFAVLFMNQHMNLTNVVIGKLGKLVHKPVIKCLLAFLEYDISKCWHRLKTPYYQRHAIETKEAVRIT